MKNKQIVYNNETITIIKIENLPIAKYEKDIIINEVVKVNIWKGIDNTLYGVIQ